MSLQTFFDNFALLADAPNGVAKLRELILQLAVEGKLVPQHSGDEPASALVKRIAIKKSRLLKDKAIRPSKPLLPIAPNETPFCIPSNWSWEKLGNAAIVIQIGPFGSLLHKSDYVRNGTPLVNPSHIKNERIVTSNDLTIDQKKKARLSNYIMQTGDIVMGRRGEMAKCAIVSERESGWLCGTGSLFIRVTDDLFRPYLLKVLTSDYVEGCLLEGSVGSTMNNLNQRILKNLLIPLPPLEEQKRIVAKVDQLMQLCDELEARQQARRESRVRLNNVTLAPLNNAASLAPEELKQASVRLADSFDTLYDSAEAVGKLRSSILQLAVRGKLVPQDPRDEPATALVEKITREKTRLSKEKKIRPPGLILSDEETETPLQLPDGWVWARFGDVTINRDGERIPIEKSIRQGRHGIHDYYGASGVIDKIDDYLFDKPLLLIGEDGANLINRATPIAFIAKGKYWVNNHAHVLDSLSLACLEYLEVFINAIDLRPYITGTAQPKMNQAKMNSILVALAPEEEQKRIVAKVSQLMALCDELETKLRQAEADSEKLMNAAVQHVLTSITDRSTNILAGAPA